ncbi:hypothetical protein AGMMS49944_21520 [Spirochaetia bacterium]|nr:hypothetical protein AGMMS49944_21520 [Spirochaetia bacterium]
MEEDESRHTGEQGIPWHTAFYEAIQLELVQYQDVLHYEFEHQLTTAPLRMDVLIIKKEKDAVLTKNIAAIFKGSNILEYKSPEDYVSVEDYYKVYGYTCLYAALNKVPITDLTISFVESRYPRDLIKHLERVRGYRVEEQGSGIYRVSGDFIPIQIIDSKRLPVEENRWLKDLNSGLDGAAINQVSLDLERQGLMSQMKAYLYAIYLANWSNIAEAAKMASAVVNFERVLTEMGLIPKWKAEGRAEGVAEGVAEGEYRKAVEMAQFLFTKGWSVEDVMDATKLDRETVQALSAR